MPLHKSTTYTVIAFALALCLVMPFLASAASVTVMATHTHVCYDNYKEDCVGERQCCRICTRDIKYRTQNPYCTIGNKLTTVPAPALVILPADFAFSYANVTTLVTLKVRLNN